eukprot:TRINITY_DN2032_c0_g1_i3.p3 TRINITY_DN2032_c0_g1~~TRINITY_DN2032_c0_g1_i3.p3  ORF type:complete len:163 (+),score=46.49 TRINITY_DN2032_c0_g1_i3:222-710(+)
MTQQSEVLYKAIQQLGDLGQSLLEKEGHDRQVALAKAAAQVGSCLAPLVGAVLDVTAVALAARTDGAPEGAPAAALRYLADPTDLAAARRVLARVRSAEGRFPTAQAGKLSHNLSPFGSVAALEAQLCWAATVLELPTAVDGEGVAGGVGKAAGDDAIADAV